MQSLHELKPIFAFQDWVAAPKLQVPLDGTINVATGRKQFSILNVLRHFFTIVFVVEFLIPVYLKNGQR
jgi:hypothetical protein